ncbi:MAG: hypothetical protein R2939_15545 [Kofleriaceae bacterium]
MSRRLLAAACAIGLGGCPCDGGGAGLPDARVRDADVCGAMPPDGGAAAGQLRVVVTADNGYTLVRRDAGGTLIAGPSIWHPGVSDEIFFGCDEYDVPADTTALYVIAADDGQGQRGVYLHAEVDGVRRWASSSAWEVCATGDVQADFTPGGDEGVAAYLALRLPGCAWAPVVLPTRDEAPLDTACFCDRADDVAWIGGPPSRTWFVYRGPMLAP